MRSCDSFGNRPVNATAANNLRQQRPAHYGSGRIRSGSMGNRPQVASTSQGGGRPRNSNSIADNATFNRALESNSGGASASNAVHFSIRKPTTASGGSAAAASAAAPTAGKENKENQKQIADAIPVVAGADK